MEPNANPNPINPVPIPGNKSFSLLPSWAMPSKKTGKIPSDRLRQIFSTKPNLYKAWIATLAIFALSLLSNIVKSVIAVGQGEDIFFPIISIGLQVLIAYYIYRMHWASDIILGVLVVLSVLSVLANGFYVLALIVLLFILNRYVLSNVQRLNGGTFTVAGIVGAAPEPKRQTLKIVLIIVGFLFVAGVAIVLLVWQYIASCGGTC